MRKVDRCPNEKCKEPLKPVPGFEKRIDEQNMQKNAGEGGDKGVGGSGG
jgi:hypothetical protein